MLSVQTMVRVALACTRDGSHRRLVLQWDVIPNYLKTYLLSFSFLVILESMTAMVDCWRMMVGGQFAPALLAHG